MGDCGGSARENWIEGQALQLPCPRKVRRLNENGRTCTSLLSRPFEWQSSPQPDTRDQMAAGLSRNAGSQPSNFLAHPEYSQSEAGEVEGYAQTRSDAMRARERNQGSGNIL